MPWISEMFGEAENWKVALTTYNMALHVNELAGVVSKDPRAIESHDHLRLSIPLAIATMADQVTRRCMSLLEEGTLLLDWTLFNSCDDVGQGKFARGWLGAHVQWLAWGGLPIYVLGRSARQAALSDAD